MTELIDAEALARQYTVRELADRAEDYFARLDDWTYHMAKPLGATLEAPVVLAHFAAMLSALDLSPGMQILDFGAGSCWTSGMLNQLGCHVIATDVSPTALAMGRRRRELQPPIGDVPELSFLPFDGHRIDLPDESVDRVTCMDAFHHVPNWEEVLAELHRVLRPGGRAVLAEGGPHHAESPQAQYEMRNFGVVERSIIVADFARLAAAAGFADTRIGLYAGVPTLVPADHFEQALADGEVAAVGTRQFLDNHRLIVLDRGGRGVRTSRQLVGLAADVVVERNADGSCTATITNTGSNVWLGADALTGTVNLGVQLHETSGRLIDLDFFRVALSDDRRATIEPGTTVVRSFVVPPLPRPDADVTFDLVAEGVGWFGAAGSTTVRIVTRDAQPASDAARARPTAVSTIGRFRPATRRRTDGLRVVVCSLGAGPHRDLAQIAEPALVAWSDRFGYDLDISDTVVDTARPPAWSKVPMLRQRLDTHDVVIGIDADAMVVDPTHDLAPLVDRRKPIAMVAHTYAGQQVPNSGVIALRSGKVTRRLLDAIWASTQYIDHKWWENAALLDLLGYDITDEPIRKVRRSRLDRRVRWLDTAWNSIPSDTAERPIITHYPGLSNDERSRRMQEDAERADRTLGP